jgi:hypothetical protein
MAAKRLFGPAQLTNAAATKYTVGAGLSALVRHVHVHNPSGGSVNFTMSVGADATGTRVFDAYPIPANSSLDWYPYLPLAAAEIIQAKDSANLLVMEMGGDENVAG